MTEGKICTFIGTSKLKMNNYEHLESRYLTNAIALGILVDS